MQHRVQYDQGHIHKCRMNSEINHLDVYRAFTPTNLDKARGNVEEEEEDHDDDDDQYDDDDNEGSMTIVRDSTVSTMIIS